MHGCTEEACQLVAEGRYQSSFAVVRPPGHHAGREKAEGFCLFNNIAVGATYLLKNHHMKKILIIDWDVHHGNGTENIFYNDDRVLYFSTHRYARDYYPETGHYKDIGEGGATGYNVNVCWDHPNIRNIDYFAVWDHLLIPIVKEFKPEAILISAGFDAAEGDPLGDCSVTASGFATLLEKLLGFGPIVMALEGGYNLRTTHSSLPMCVASCIRVLLGDNIDVISETESSLNDSTWKMIQEIRTKLKPVWRTLASEIPEDVTPECTPSISTD